MTIRLRTLFFLITGIILVWFLYIERTLLTPVILGAIFAYIFNPVVNFFSKKVHLPRNVTAVVVYLVIMTVVVILGTIITRSLLQESSEIRQYATTLLQTTKTQINSLPDWLRPTARSGLISLQKSRFASSLSLLPFFPGAISRIISFIIFLVSGFYFLREGSDIFENGILLLPKNYRTDIKMLLEKINAVFSGYLRGQIFLVFLMGIVTFLALSIIGVRFAVILAVFSGFAEIVPIFGPIVAASISITIVLITAHANFHLDPINAAIIVALVYFILRNAEDYFVIPHVMGKITKLPPYIIFFAVIACGHLWGVLGLILAVPLAAVVKILLEYSLERLEK